MFMYGLKLVNLLIPMLRLREILYPLKTVRILFILRKFKIKKKTKTI